MSNKATQTVRTVRVSKDLWDNAKARADKEGTDVSTLIRQWMYAYVNPPPPPFPSSNVT